MARKKRDFAAYEAAQYVKAMKPGEYKHLPQFDTTFYKPRKRKKVGRSKRKGKIIKHKDLDNMEL